MARSMRDGTGAPLSHSRLVSNIHFRGNDYEQHRLAVGAVVIILAILSFFGLR